MLNAIMCAWNEEDIIGSSVKNALVQGCDRVFIIDNASSDRTVQQAVRAGAVYHATFTTDEFDEIQKTVYLNKCALGINEQLPDDKNWWLYLDADEFPDFNTGKTIKETLAELPPDVRAVGSHLCNHVPTHKPYYLSGYHPIDFMPVGRLLTHGPWKFNLLRHDRGKPPIYSRSGAHTYNGNGVEIVESEAMLINHHFNYRRPEVTRKRLEDLTLPDENGKRRSDWYDRLSHHDKGVRCLYHDRLEQMDKLYEENRLGNLRTGELDYDFTKVARWYAPSSIDIGAAALPDFDRFVWEGTQAYFLKDFETALFRFNDALEKTVDPLAMGLLLLGMARCYVKQGDPTYNTIVGIMRQSPLPEVRRLADTVETL